MPKFGVTVQQHHDVEISHTQIVDYVKSQMFGSGDIIIGEDGHVYRYERSGWHDYEYDKKEKATDKQIADWKLYTDLRILFMLPNEYE